MGAAAASSTLAAEAPATTWSTDEDDAFLAYFGPLLWNPEDACKASSSGSLHGSMRSRASGGGDAESVLESLLAIEDCCCPFVAQGASPVLGATGPGSGGLTAQILIDQTERRYCCCRSEDASEAIGVLWARFPEVPLELALQALQSEEERKAWDEFSQFRLLQAAAPDDPTQAEVWHVCTQAPWPLADRDFLWRQWLLPLEGAHGPGYALVVRSFEDDGLLPERMGFARGIVQHQGCLLRPAAQGAGLELTCCTQLDLGGLIPAWAQGFLIEFGAQYALMWSDALRNWCNRGRTFTQLSNLSGEIPSCWAEQTEADVPMQAATGGSRATAVCQLDPSTKTWSELSAALPSHWADADDPAMEPAEVGRRDSWPTDWLTWLPSLLGMPPGVGGPPPQVEYSNAAISLTAVPSYSQGQDSLLPLPGSTSAEGPEFERVLNALLSIERLCCPPQAQGSSAEAASDEGLSFQVLMDQPDMRYCCCQSHGSPVVSGVLWVRYPDVTVAQARQALCEVEQRAEWDTQSVFQVLRGATPDDATREEVWHVSTRSPWPLQDRDFLLHQWELPLDGVHGQGRAIIQRSFDDPDLLPQSDGYIRGFMTHQGWLLRPIPSSVCEGAGGAGGISGEGLELTVCSQLDLGGAIPAWAQAGLVRFAAQFVQGWAESLRQWCKSRAQLATSAN